MKSKVVFTALGTLGILTACLQNGQTNLFPEPTAMQDNEVHQIGMQQAGIPKRSKAYLSAAAALPTPVPAALFVDPLPIPKLAVASGTTAAGQALYKMTMSKFSQFVGFRTAAGVKVNTNLWGYNGTYPGPTISATQNAPIAVDFVNTLPATPLFPVDHNIMGTFTTNPTTLVNTPTADNRAVVHHHGGNNAAVDDGFPTSWTTSGTRRYIFTNNQTEMTTWYHDHAIGIGRYNVYAGLAGAYVIKPAATAKTLGFRPPAARDIPLLIQDKSFDVNGQLNYNNQVATWQPEMIGDRLLVNGMMYPYLNVSNNAYRFRIVNASNARFYNIQLSAQANITATTANAVIPFDVVASDNGLLPTAQSTTSLLVAPGERYEIYVNFNNAYKLGYRNVVVTNDAAAPYQAITPAPPVAPEVAQIMKFNINTGILATVTDPATLVGYVTPGATGEPAGELEPISETPKVVIGAKIAPPAPTPLIRNMELQEVLDANGFPTMLMLNGKHFSDPVTETVKANSVETWNFVNLTADTHPMHLHGMRFRVVQRQGYDVAKYIASGAAKTISFIDPVTLATYPVLGPSVAETGWKDTVKAHPGQITTVSVLFSTYTGNFVWHCHILEHEDNDMMRPMTITP